MAIEPDTRTSQPVTPKNYSVLAGARVALEALAAACHPELPVAFKRHVDQVTFTASTAGTDEVCFPCPLKEQDLGAALKALEGCVAAMIADVRYGSQDRPISVDMGKATAFLMSAYLTTLDGMGKSHPKMKYRLPGSLPYYYAFRVELILSQRYRPQSSSVHSLQTSVCQSLRDSHSRRVLPHSWITGGEHDPYHAWLASFHAWFDRLP